MSGRAQGALALARLLERVFLGVLALLLVALHGDQVNLGHGIEECAQIALVKHHVVPIPLGALHLQALHLGARRGPALGFLPEELESKLQCVDLEVELARLVLKEARQEGLCEVEHGHPEGVRLFALDPVADRLQLLQQVLEVESQLLHGGLGNVVGLPAGGHQVVEQFARQRVHGVVHHFQTVDRPLQVVDRREDLVD